MTCTVCSLEGCFNQWERRVVVIGWRMKNRPKSVCYKYTSTQSFLGHFPILQLRLRWSPMQYCSQLWREVWKSLTTLFKCYVTPLAGPFPFYFTRSWSTVEWALWFTKIAASICAASTFNNCKPLHRYLKSAKGLYNFNAMALRFLVGPWGTALSRFRSIGFVMNTAFPWSLVSVDTVNFSLSWTAASIQGRILLQIHVQTIVLCLLTLIFTIGRNKT